MLHNREVFGCTPCDREAFQDDEPLFSALQVLFLFDDSHDLYHSLDILAPIFCNAIVYVTDFDRHDRHEDGRWKAVLAIGIYTEATYREDTLAKHSS
jgi:hypothetical protein